MFPQGKYLGYANIQPFAFQFARQKSPICVKRVEKLTNLNEIDFIPRRGPIRSILVWFDWVRFGWILSVYFLTLELCAKKQTCLQQWGPLLRLKLIYLSLKHGNTSKVECVCSRLYELWACLRFVSASCTHSSFLLNFYSLLAMAIHVVRGSLSWDWACTIVPLSQRSV